MYINVKFIRSPTELLNIYTLVSNQPLSNQMPMQMTPNTGRMLFFLALRICYMYSTLSYV